jgi:hypothetical protein
MGTEAYYDENIDGSHHMRTSGVPTSVSVLAEQAYHYYSVVIIII